MPFSRSSEGEASAAEAWQGPKASEAASRMAWTGMNRFLFITRTLGGACYAFVTPTSFVCPAPVAAARSSFSFSCSYSFSIRPAGVAEKEHEYENEYEKDQQPGRSRKSAPPPSAFTA